MTKTSEQRRENGTLVPNSFQHPNLYIDHLSYYLTPEEEKVLNKAIREILGWEKRIASRENNISLSVFVDGKTSDDGEPLCLGCGLGLQAVRKAIAGLVRYNVLAKVGQPTQDGQRYRLIDDAESIRWDALKKRRAGWDAANARRTRKATEASLESRGVASDVAGQGPDGVTSDVTPGVTSDVRANAPGVTSDVRAGVTSDVNKETQKETQMTTETQKETQSCAAIAPPAPDPAAPASILEQPNSAPDPAPAGTPLDDLTPDQRRRALARASGLTAAHHAERTGGAAARIGDPAEPTSPPGGNGHNSSDPNWAGKVRLALSRRSRLDPLTTEHVIALFRRFEERSGIVVPGDASQLRGWAAGLRDVVAPWLDYLKSQGHHADIDSAVRLAAWAMDVIFARKESGQITWSIYSPHSLIKASRALTADCRRLQQAQDLPAHRPPTWSGDADAGAGRDWTQSDDPAVQAILEQEQWYQNRSAHGRQAQAQAATG